MARVLLLGSLAESLINFRGPLIAELARRGHEVIGCAPPGDPQIDQRLAALGATFHPLPMRRTGRNPFGDVAVLLRLVRLLRRLRPEVVLAYTVKPIVYGSFACMLTRIGRCNAIVTGLGWAFMPAAGLAHRAVAMLVRVLYRAALPANRVVFFQNPDDRDQFLAEGLLRDHDRAVVIPGSGVDLERFRPAPLPPGAPVFLLIARLLRDKGVREYADATRILRERHPQIRALLVGPFDPHPDAIDPDEVDRWQRTSGIEYLGATEDVRPCLAAASVYVLPSYREGTPRTVLEAMAMGRAVVTTDTPGCRQTVIDGHNGFLVPPRDATSLARAMERFVTDPGLAAVMGLRGRRKVELEYDVHRVNGEIIRCLGL